MIVKIAIQNILQKPLNTILSVLLLMASVTIILVVLLLQNNAEKHFDNSIKEIDLVMGAKGSPMQLILSAVYQMDAPTGNISYAEAQKWMQHPFIKKAIPLAYGDNYNGFKIVGTTPDYIQLYRASVQEGEINITDFQVVIGSEVALKSGLKIGSSFHSIHGSSENGAAHTEKSYQVAGILHPTKTVIDGLIVCSIPSVWQSHAHEEEHDHHDYEGHDHESDQEITAILLQVKNKMAFVMWPRLIANNTAMQVASPAIETNRLYSLLGIGVETLTAIAYGILAISGVSIFIALYTNVKDKKFEFALLRTLGASRAQLLLLVYVESLVVTFSGYALGLLISRFSIQMILQSEQEMSFLSNDIFSFTWNREGLVLLVVLLISMIAATIPAVKAYRLSITKTLAHV